jgi:hypothetical protein
MLSARNSRFFFTLAFSTFLSLMFVSTISAQCDYNPFGFQGASVEPNNPLQAEYSTNGLLRNFTGTTAGTRPLAVARDSQGRVRTDNSAGMYKAKSPGGQQTEVERRIIWICDPVSKNSIRLDTGDKTATIQRALPRPPRLPPLPVVDDQRSFCTRLFDSRKGLRFTRTEDLGRQIIEGFDAVGLREWPGSLRPTNAETHPASSYKDMWCSDQIGAVTLQSHVTANAKFSNKSDTLMRKIQRVEPNPSLFQIPSDYTILEREQPLAAADSK